MKQYIVGLGEALYQDAMNALLPNAYEAAVKEAGLEVVAQPKIDVTSMEKGQDWVITAEVVTKPEVKLGEYKNLEVFLKDTQNFQESELIELFVGVRDAAYTIINKKGATYYGIAVALARITKAILDDENAVLPLSVFQEGQYGVKNVFIGQPAVVGAHGIVRPVNIPLNDAETQKMHASAKELQAIIDEAWKNPEFQAASKN